MPGSSKVLLDALRFGYSVLTCLRCLAALWEPRYFRSVLHWLLLEAREARYLNSGLSLRRGLCLAKIHSKGF